MPTFLHLLRVSRKERYSQTEIDYLFYSIALPNITCRPSVSGASDAEINVLQQFLDRCHKLRFISTKLNIRSLLHKQDEAIFKKLSSITGKNNGFPFLDILGYLKNTHESPKFDKVRQVPTGNSQPSSLVWTCLTLPNLGFLWVFFKYPKISKNGNLFFFFLCV